MKKTSLGKLGLVSALVIMLLSGCVVSTGSVTVNLPSDKPGASEHLFLRYSDGSVVQVPDDTGTGSIAVNTESGKTIVGGYVSDSIVSWVPVLSYSSSYVNVSGFAAHKPTVAADHVALFQAPAVADSAYPGYINVTFAVYGTNGELVDGQ
ncbi:hypothetical protein, partial [Paenibacillus ihuae]|uniref:hypothetical protein n=1 Tax=Paenibacillus ihuae TaxID=1232431 RepID=UPI00131DB280